MGDERLAGEPANQPCNVTRIAGESRRGGFVLVLHGIVADDGTNKTQGG
jgi:hypothetical protein